MLTTMRRTIMEEVIHEYENILKCQIWCSPAEPMIVSPGRGIVKPIAFKPVVPNPKPTSTPKHFNEQVRKYSSHDDGYGSQDYGVTSSHNICHECIRTSDRADSVAASHMSRLSSNQIEGYIQTPSPSDSGVGELEAILKEKDAEINTLRDVMDKNERAIFQVYDEKRNGWIREIQEIRDEYEGKLKQLQRKQYKSDQVLNLQVFKLQQDKKTMKDEMDKLVAEKDDLAQKCEVFANETNALQAQMDDATWQGRRRSSPSDINGLHNEIDSLRHKLTAKSNEVLQLTGQLSDMKSRLEETSMHFDHHRCRADLSSESLQRMNNSGSDLEPDIPLCHCEKQIQTDLSKALTPERETLKPSLICEKDKEVIALREEVEKLRLDVLVNKEEHDKEKEQWLEEKNKVIMYQKQLQLNYVQMFRKNKVLEAEVEQLTLELESRDMKLMALNGEESVC
ncbi:LZTS2-like protein [Mya arenaria]|uniref:LZTS2-like protein n=1 Tax=Mya arenaria TaxID=6604 RepID=A0ABY7FLQ4_MYAAR|nr:LZTS2-like protein [Mya arenaria]